MQGCRPLPVNSVAKPTQKQLWGNVWFQKISIPLPRRELEIPEGWGDQRPRKFRRGGGVVSEFTFPDGQVRCHANLFQNRFLPTLKIFYIEKIAA